MNDEDKAFFLSWCIEEYASEKNICATDVASMFSQHKVMEYLDENADVLHTQGKFYILGSIDDFLKSRLATLKD